MPTTTWAPVARVSAAHPGNVARPVFCGIGSSTAVPTRPVFNGIGSSIAVPTPGAGFALTRATTWAPVARVSAAHPGGCGPARFLWHRFINRRANPALFQWPSSFNRRANPGCGRCPYPGYQLNLMVSDSPGSNSFCTMPSSGGGVGAGATGTWAFACAVARARDQSASKVMFCTAYNWP